MDNKKLLPEASSGEDFSTSLTYRFFQQQLNPEFIQRGFLLNQLPLKECNEHRYILRYTKEFYDIHGNYLVNEVKFEGIPMSNNILVCHAKVKQSEASFRS